jgi:FG-GAP repeat
MKRITALTVSSLPFVILISILVLARSSSTPAVSQPDVFPVDREPYPGVSPNFPQMLQESRFARRGGGAVKPTVRLSGTLANAARPGASPSTSSTGLSSLPRDAQRPISAALGKDNSRYWAHANADGFSAENPQHVLGINFARLGVELESHNLRWRLETRGYGYGDALRPLSPVAPHATANRVEYRRGAATEWYLNGPMGLEQGFRLAEPPGKARKRRNQPLTLALAISGDLVAVLEPAGLDKKSTALTLTRKDGQAALRYTGLNVRDAVGRELRSWLELRGKYLMLRVEDSGARYPVVVDPWIQQAELTASDGGYYDHFGWSVAISGNTIVVGAVCHPGTSINWCVGADSGGPGAAYVFAESGGTWSQQQELTASDGAAGDWFGESVAVDHSTVVVGAPLHKFGRNASQGAAYVFVQSGTTWSQEAELTSSDGAAGNKFGESVAVDDSTVVVGAPLHKFGRNASQGAAYVFVQSGTTWGQEAELTSSDGAAGDEFGWSVAVSGSTAIVGPFSHTVGTNAKQGAAYVFVQSGTTWSQQAELTASDGAANDYFGYSVAVSGGTAVVGSPGLVTFIRSSTYAGAAYVFVQSGTTWSQQAKLIASDGAGDDNFGNSVAVDENTGTAVVGALNHAVDRTINNMGDQGAAYVFVQSGTTWGQQAELTASDWAGDDNLGTSVALSGSTAVAGAPWHDVGSNKRQGAAYVFVPGAITVTLPTSLNFANEALDNASAAKTVTLTNSSTGTLSIAGITLNGDFDISSTTCGVILTAGKACKVNVTFTAMELGMLTGTLTFTDNASNSPQTVALSGTGIVQATLNPASETYGKRTIGTTSDPKTLTLANKQNVPLTGIAISTTGDFAVSATTCGTSLAAKGNCTISVTFTPTAIGTRTGQLSVKDSANNSPQASSSTGTGH